MSELFGRTNEIPSMEGEILKALVGKVMDLEVLVKENMDQIRRLMEHVEEMRELKDRMISQEKQVGELIQLDAEVKEALQQLAGKMNLPVEKVELLQGALEHQVRLFERPLDKTVRHHHLLGKAFWILAGMMLLCSGASTMLIWQWERAGQYAADEMRWRSVKLINDPAVTAMVDRIESASLVDPKGFSREIEAEENRREDLTRNILREQEARRRIDELEKQKAKK